MFKPKIQMRIGFWGGITFLVLQLYFVISEFIFAPHLSHVTRLSMIAILAIFGYYIEGIRKKKIATVRTAFCIWWISYGIVVLGFLWLTVLDRSDFKSTLITFLSLIFSFGFMTFILWMGLRGLERIMEAEHKLNKTLATNATLSELDKPLVNNITANADEAKWPGFLWLIIILAIAWFVPQNIWWGRIIFYILMAMVVLCLCSIFPFIRKLIFRK